MCKPKLTYGRTRPADTAALPAELEPRPGHAAGFKVLLQEATNARIAFLNAARHDYNSKWWQFLAPRRERAYLKAQKS